MNCKKVIFVVGILAVLGLFGPNAPGAQAMTAAELQALIQQLQQQIQQLQQQLAATQNTAPVWCHDFNANLKIGDASSETMALQTALQKEGLLNNVTNQFDEQTASAITGFQQKYASEVLTPLGLKYGTGFAGAATRAKLNKLYGCGATIPVTPVPTQSTTTTAPSITVISPNGGEQWTVGKAYIIKWNSIGLDKIYIQLGSTNDIANGYITTVIATNINAADGSYQWTVPASSNSLSGSLSGYLYHKIWVLASGYGATNAISDASDSYFSIVAATTTTAGTTCIDSDNGKDYYTKGTTKWGPIGGQYYQATDACDSAGKTLSENYCYYSDNLKGYYSATEYYACPTGCSDGACLKAATTTPSITVTSPLNGASWQLNTWGEVTWLSSGNATLFDIYLIDSSGQSSSLAKAHSEDFYWVVGFFNGNESLLNGKYTIAVCPTGEPTIDAQCGKSNITIAGTIPVISLTNPKGGETFRVGDSISVSFSNAQVGDKYQIALFQQTLANPAYSLGTITAQTNGQITNVFAIPSNVPVGTYTIQIEQLTNGKIACVNACALSNESNSFSIVATTTAPSITVNATTTTSRAAPCGQTGDITADGYITQADITDCQKCIAKTLGGTICNLCNVNGDSQVNSSDITSLERYISGADATFKACPISLENIANQAASISKAISNLVEIIKNR